MHQMLQKGGKYLISGIGGVGKTELMRQFLTDCRNEDLVDYEKIAPWKAQILKLAFTRFEEKADEKLKGEYKKFKKEPFPLDG